MLYFNLADLFNNGICSAWKPADLSEGNESEGNYVYQFLTPYDLNFMYSNTL